MLQGRHRDPKATHPQPVAALHSGVEEALHSEPVLPKLLPADMRLVPAVDGSRDSMHAGTVSQRPGTHKHTLLSGASNSARWLQACRLRLARRCVSVCSESPAMSRRCA